MPWELTIWKPTGDSPRVFTDATTPNPLKAKPEIIVDAGGRTNSISLRVRNDILQAGPRDIIRWREWAIEPMTYQGQRLTFNGERLHFRVWDVKVGAGVIVSSPPITSPGSGPADRDADALDRISAVGLEHLLTERIVRTGPTIALDVATIAYNLCRDYAHPAIIVNQSNFPPTGYQLGVFYTPEKTLEAALNDLIATLPSGGRYHINADRGITFRGSP